MRAVDTNVLVRLLVRDDPAQLTRAEEFVSKGAWVPLAAIVECAWVLAATYELPESRISDALEKLTNNEQLVFQDEEVVRAAVASFRDKPTIQFADAVIIESARRAGHLPLGTFDRKLATRKGAVRI